MDGAMKTHDKDGSEAPWRGPVPTGAGGLYWLTYQITKYRLRFRILEPADTEARRWLAPTNAGSNDTTEDLPKTDEEAFGHGFVKWDGCFQMFFHPDANLHLDDTPRALACLQDTILDLAWRIPASDGGSGMTREDVERRVDAMRPPRGDSVDDEGGHRQKDDLYLDVLRTIAHGSDDAPGLATAALKTRAFVTARWYG